MKKILCAVALMLCFMTGCSNNGKVKNIEPVPQNFTAQVVITNEYAQYEATLVKNGSDTTLCYSAPASLAGLEITKAANSVKFNFLGMSMMGASSFLPQKSAFGVIDSAINIICGDNNGYTLKKSGRNYYYSGFIDGKEFSVVRSVETLDITTITFPTESLTIEFTSFEKTESQG